MADSHFSVKILVFIFYVYSIIMIVFMTVTPQCVRYADVLCLFRPRNVLPRPFLWEIMICHISCLERSILPTEILTWQLTHIKMQSRECPSCLSSLFN